MKTIAPLTPSSVEDDAATVAVRGHRKPDRKGHRLLQYQTSQPHVQKERPNIKFYSDKLRRNQKSFDYMNDDPGSRIRRRYLHRLGLHPPNEFVCGHFCADGNGPRCLRYDPRPIHDSPMRMVPLKDNKGVLDRLMNLYFEAAARPMERNGDCQKVSFNNFVLVNDIPNRDMYSERIKRTIWISSDEAAKSIVQNTIEYMAEGNDPCNVVEEKDFIWRNNKLVHPVCRYLEASEHAKIRLMYYEGIPNGNIGNKLI